ncbi:MAG: A/G-specific adenine glycosylase [Gemmatimonadota bacterium]
MATIRHRLLTWYDAHARDLPWRRTDDPYAVWVSEVMLQQTRVNTVIPFWTRWMERFPTVAALADARLDDVLASWEGLGYYRRARLLHRAAARVRDRHRGELPRDVAGLRELPGVGEYTAGAVASIAFGRRVPAVDGNVRRVLARLHDLPTPSPAQLRERAARLVPPERPGDFNQALMELGATVCSPTSPRCGSCPLERVCRARALGVQEDRPRPQRRGRVPERRFGVAVARRVRNGGPTELLVVKRPVDGMLGGLWEFPTARLSDGEAPATGALRALDAADAGRKGALRPMAPVRHAYSHFVGIYRPFLATVADGPEPRGDGREPPQDEHERRWVSPAGADALPMPGVQNEILRAALAALGGRAGGVEGRDGGPEEEG